MTKKEIVTYASQQTFVWNRTLLYFKNSKLLVGYFNGNLSAMDKDAPNEWQFVCLPKETDKEVIIVINGDDLVKIEITEFAELKNKLSSQ